MYSLPMFGAMQTDAVRMDAYTAALEALVTPGALVLDIGAGPGIMTLLACRLGAGRVEAVDLDDTINVARQIVELNGYADRVRCRQVMSTEIALTPGADVVVADLRGVLPLYEANIPSLIDARMRLLSPTGSLVPRRDWIMGAIVSAPEKYAALVSPWEEGPMDLRLDPGRDLAVQHWFRVSLSSDQRMSDAQAIAELDYLSITSPNLAAHATWVVDRPGTVHGLALWFRTELCDGVGYETGPDQPPTGYGQAFFPFEHEVQVEAGARVCVTLSADLIAGDYLWTWRTRIDHDGTEIASFDQSTFAGAALSQELVRTRSAASVPRLNAAGDLDRRLLSLMDGTRTLDEIAQVVGAEHSRLDHADALRRAADLAERYAPADDAPVEE